MYYRLYPSRNNTIFKYNSVTSAGLFPLSEKINCGANPIMELQDGKGESQLMFAFDLPEWLRLKLSQTTYSAKLQLWDAGTLFAPAPKLKEVTLRSFTEDFIEGDGYSFLPPEHKEGVSNWLNRTATDLWVDVIFTPVLTYHLNKANEDLNFNVTSAIASNVLSLTNPRFALSFTLPEYDTMIYTKYIHSNHTKTVFKPYIEFFIDDVIDDRTYDCIGGQENKTYLINQTGKPFTGTLSATVMNEGQDLIIPDVTVERPGVYSIKITPSVPIGSAKMYSTVLWAINGVDMKKQLITIVNPNQFEETIDYKNLFFYPTTPHTHAIARQGDVLPFEIVSQIRGKGNVTVNTYEYKVTTADGFEMVPWSKASVYRDKMFFNLNTEYFFPEQQYEVWVRNNAKDFTITSNNTHKFKLAMNDKSHLRELTTSPYYSREVYFGK